MAHLTTMTRVYRIDVDFFSGGDQFASEIISFEIEEGAEVWTAAYLAAEGSPYFDLRIPELSYRFSFVPGFPDKPDPTSPVGALKPVCRDCGCDMLARDASARWDVQQQAWAISGVYDCTFCGLCNAESDDLVRWVPAGDITPLEVFSAALAAKLNVAGLGERPEFQRFCFDNCLHQSVDQAAVAWWGTGEMTP